MRGTRAGDWVSMAVPADGSYGIAPGVVYSFPCECKDGDYKIVQGLTLDAFRREKLDASDRELREERAAVESLLG
jgi:malate dehydrogenase